LLFFALSVTTSLKIPGAFIPRRVFTQGPAVPPVGQWAQAATNEKLWPISVFFLPVDTNPATHIDWCANNIALALHRFLVQT
jgi:hypothetical protein